MRAGPTAALAVVTAGAVGLGIVLLGRGATNGGAAPAPRVAPVAPAEAPRLEGSGLPHRSSPATERADAARWIAAMDGADAAASEDALAGLRDLLRRERLTPEDLLRIALRPEASGPVGIVRQRAIEALQRLEPAKLLAVFPALLDALEKGTEAERAVAATIVPALAGSSPGYGRGPAAAGTVPDEVRAAFLAALPRTSALVADESAPLDVRLAMLPLLEALGGDAAGVAPSLIAWIEATYRERKEYQEQNPNIHVSWNHTEFRVQEALSRLGPRVLPLLLEAMRATEDGRYAFAQAIREMGPESLDALRALLADPDDKTRAIAVAAVARAGKDRPETAAVLRDALRDPSPAVRVAAIEGSGPFGDALAEELVAALSDPDADVRSAATLRVQRLADGAESARARLLKLLATGEYGERLGAMGALAKLGPAAAEAAPLVVDLLADRLPSGREEWALEPYVAALKAFGPASVRALVEVAASADAAHRRAAVFALPRLEGVTPQDLAPLSSVLRSLTGEDRIRMAGLVAAEDPSAVRVLVEALGGDDLDLRTAAAEGLGRAGPAAVETLPQIAALLRETEVRLHAEGAVWGKEWPRYYASWLALQAVGRHAPQDVVAYVDDASGDVSQAAALALGAAGEAGATVVQAAWPRLSPAGRAVVLLPLWPTGREAPPPSATARRIVVAALDDPSPRVRLTAARVARGDDLMPRILATRIGLLAATEEGVAQDAAWDLRSHSGSLAAYEARLRAALPPEGTTARAWVQDVLDRLAADR